MKKIITLFLTSALLLTACGGGAPVIDNETLDANPEVADISAAWQNLVDAAENEDCEAFLEGMRLSVDATEEDCPAAFEYLADYAGVEWSKTEWNASGGKAKIYEIDGGSITGLILNEATGVWGADEKFWE
jgi:hypothetical protein